MHLSVDRDSELGLLGGGTRKTAHHVAACIPEGFGLNIVRYSGVDIGLGAGTLSVQSHAPQARRGLIMLAVSRQHWYL